MSQQSGYQIRNFIIAAVILLQVALACFVVSSVTQSPKIQEKTESAKQIENTSKDDDLSGMRRVYRDQLLNDTSIDASDWNVGPEFLDYLGQRKQKNIEHIHLGRQASNETVALLRGNPMRRLEIDQCEATRECLKDIADMTGLEYLSLTDMHLNIEDMKTIISLPLLNRLTLHRCQLDDNCVKVLSKHQYTYLVLDRNFNLTDKGVANFAKQKIVSIGLGETKITDKIAPVLAGMPSLELVYLWGDKIGDRSMPWFSKMPHLQQLFLRRTLVTDRGLDNFHPPAGFTDLWIKECPTTAAGLRRFHKRYPLIRVSTFVQY